MPFGDPKKLDEFVEPAGMVGVYLIASDEIEIDRENTAINGKPVTTVAPHPYADGLYYVTTEHPELLAFLPEAYTEL